MMLIPTKHLPVGTLDFRSATTENNVIYYKVYVTVDDAKGKLLPTMTARTEIIDEANDVTIVPLNCIYSEGSRHYVKVYNEKTKETRDVDVKLGLTSDSEVAVTATGLSVGDKLLVKKAVSKQTSNRMGPRRCTKEALALCLLSN